MDELPTSAPINTNSDEHNQRQQQGATSRQAMHQNNRNRETNSIENHIDRIINDRLTTILNNMSVNINTSDFAEAAA